MRWHELECGGYRADLGLWRELADRASRPPGRRWICEIGAGSGRVALELARGGHRVLALDRDARLLDALRARANGANVRTVLADARSFTLPVADLGACLVPMQTIQLLPDAGARAAFLARARAHTRDGGILACAIVEEIEPFSARSSGPAPDADTRLIDGRLHSSRPVAVRCDAETITIERERVVHAGASPRSRAERRQLDVAVLRRLSASQLQREGAAAGFRGGSVHVIPATEHHVAGTVVVLDA